MGITGLLPALKSIQKPCSLKKFAGQTIGVDAYGWLHRGITACAVELATNKPSKKFVDFAMHRVRMLVHFGITPFLVFDGDFLPSKASTEAGRNARRQESRRVGLELLAAGKNAQAHLELQKAIDVSPDMARQLIDELKKTGVRYVVAPYEADAQLVYMERKNLIQGILSEDSDLLVFGAKCLLTKLDQYGDCMEINRADFCACREMAMTGWTDAQFRQMAILSGCDYLNSISNMGLKTAHRMMRKYKTVEQVIRMLQFDGKYSVPKDYLASFRQAEQTFLYQRVFCLAEQTIVLHTEPEGNIDLRSMPFIGAYVDAHTARAVACGDLDPFTKLPIRATRPAGTFAAAATAGSLYPGIQTKPGSKKCFASESPFRPKRTPLSELSPNCFTPSPSQQELLLRNSATQRINPATRSTRGRGTPGATYGQVSSSGTAILGIHTPCPVSVSSELRPPKRTRLCADDDSPPKLKDAGDAVCRSQYFPGGSPDNARATSRNIFEDHQTEESRNAAVSGGRISISPLKPKDSLDESSGGNIGFAVFEDDPSLSTQSAGSIQRNSVARFIPEHNLEAEHSTTKLRRRSDFDERLWSSHRSYQYLRLPTTTSLRCEGVPNTVSQHNSEPLGQIQTTPLRSDPFHPSRIPRRKHVPTSIVKHSQNGDVSMSRQLSMHTIQKASPPKFSAIPNIIGTINVSSRHRPSYMTSRAQTSESNSAKESLAHKGASTSTDSPRSDRGIFWGPAQPNERVQGSEDYMSHSSDSECGLNKPDSSAPNPLSVY